MRLACNVYFDSAVMKDNIRHNDDSTSGAGRMRDPCFIRLSRRHYVNSLASVVGYGRDVNASRLESPGRIQGDVLCCKGAGEKTRNREGKKEEG